jgi:Mg/Co/Ni transporter MgtE
MSARGLSAAALASKLLLGYVEDSVGAWTDPDVLALPGATRAAEALERVRHIDATVQRVFVTGSDGRLEGWVPLPALLRAPEGATLASVMQRPDGVMSAKTPLAGALAHPGWESSSLLPVLESGERLVGVLTRDALTRALGRSARATPAIPGETLAGMLALGYWDALSGGAEAMVTLLPPVKAVGGRPGER